MTVLGHYPSYRNLSDELRARHFEVTSAGWQRLGQFQLQWLENKHFLDRTLLRGDPIILSTSPRYARRGSSFSMELRYLALQGKRTSRPVDLLD